MIASTRRQFLSHVGRGMLLAGLGPAVAYDLAVARPTGEGGGERLDFGPWEPLVGLMQDTPAAELQPLLVERLRKGDDLKTLVAAAALANARTFGGEDYDGYHCEMALVPALQMAGDLDGDARALPVFKVLYRNTARMRKVGGAEDEVLTSLDPASGSGETDGIGVRDAARRADAAEAERRFATVAAKGPEHAWNELQPAVRDDINVHRIVLAWRAWDLLRLVGREHAHTMLRQCVRFFVYEEEHRISGGNPEPEVRSVVPALLDEYGLLTGRTGEKRATDDQVAAWARTLAYGTRKDGAECVARALSQGYAADDVGEALSLASNTLLLADPGRKRDQSMGRVKGSVHGASVGVHASDATAAWRSVAACSAPEHAVASLVTAGYHTAGQSRYVDAEPVDFERESARLEGKSAKQVLAALGEAVEGGDQLLACAAGAAYGKTGADASAFFRTVLRYNLDQDGALHAEKYYRTAREEYERARPAFRDLYLTSLARVTASQQGYAAPGQKQARELLGV